MTPRRAPATPPRVMPLKQAAREHGIPYTTLRAAHFRGELAVVKLGASVKHRAWYVSLEELARFLEANTERCKVAG
jgi:hypothetical protein